MILTAKGSEYVTKKEILSKGEEHTMEEVTKKKTTKFICIQTTHINVYTNNLN